MLKNHPIASRVALVAMAVAVVAPTVLASFASAASLTQVTVRFDRMKIGTQTTGTVCAKPTSTATEANVKVTFPTGYALGAAGTFTTDTTTNTASWPATSTAWLGIGTATNVTGQTVTFPSGDLVVGTIYCFNWINAAAVQVKGTASASNSGLVETYTVTPTLIDSSNYSTASIADDQIVVTATVPQAFSFTLSGNTDPLGLITSGTVSSSPTPRTVTINTNASSGWSVWAKETNGGGGNGLFSVTANNTIASTTPGTNSTLVGTADGYNTGVTSSNGGGTGTITVAAPFVGGSTGKGGGLDGNLRTLATSNGTATTHVLTLTNNVSVAGATKPANDYTDTITVVGAATF